jgi:hypothetical protein
VARLCNHAVVKMQQLHLFKRASHAMILGSICFCGSFSFGAHIGLTSVELRAPPLHKRAFELFAGEECDCKLAVPLVAMEIAIHHVTGIVIVAA